MIEDNLDIQAFRQTLGQFATGVTVVTALASDGEPVGITANSFNSVSMEPPLILWSLAKNAMSLGIFQNAGFFTVHVLAADQEELSNRFASRGTDKFFGVDFAPGINGAPLLDGCAADFQCRTMHQYDGGDHVIFVGEVLSCTRADKAPLVYHGGRYAAALPKVAGDAGAGEAVDLQDGSFTSDFFIYLLSRAHNQFSNALLAPDAELDLPRAGYHVLSVLCRQDGLGRGAVSERLSVTGQDLTDDVFNRLLELGFISLAPGNNGDNGDSGDVGGGGDIYNVTDSGRQFQIALLARSVDLEDHAFAGFAPEEIALLRDMLRRLIEKTDTGLSTLWG